jgi:hypothetical protein
MHNGATPVANEIRVIDARVGRSFKDPRPSDIVCERDADLNELFARVADAGYHPKLDLLMIFSHAFYEKDSAGGHHYGFGIQLGQQGIHNDNVAALMGRLNGRFANALRGIELRGCAVAIRSDFGTGPAHKVGDGLALCQLIADTTNTGVLASSAEQPGTCEVVTGQMTARAGGRVTTTEVKETQGCDVGVWSGAVWLFTPGAKGKAKRQ